ncbi:MAG: hypothetical protein MJ194_07340, partial [Clostridia bacterium]|nr:hypothetical protein [Clostridia bacterium]
MATDEDRGENLPNDCNTDTQMNVYNEDDSNFNSNSMQIAQTTSTALLTSIVDQLTALNLPADVLNSLESVAAGIVAALADGPLPLGDFLLLASTSGLAIAVANNWNSIYTKWSSIISVFTNAFASISSDVEDTFDEVQRNVSTYQNVPSISTNGKVASVAGVQYNCIVKASEMTQGQKQNNYYVAILFGNEVYFDSTRPIT